MSGRVLAQILITGSQIIGKAFVEAYKVAAADAAKNASRSAVKADADPLTHKTGITVEESLQILNIPKESSLEKITSRYSQLFKINDPATGGSFYLQSKIYRAKERLELELESHKVKEEESTGPTEPKA
ncbi:mitochondrial import inner membrane translocase subunit TIM16 [Entomophthora muscae]|uniref:Mitochondrial import inner membrane translocase subunit TIM16 n=2 Tax=Entomophthora muscae TaxID=34485 RepID=A0ACC2SE65_9FUNG|nr:mitochondrial import inner membrane translocase subunit TIM16 [Entomophthora muscae]KAJ9067001.1 mitochondrial import inner membrane translocase subunit TIM16 [Entomophthora muscae]